MCMCINLLDLLTIHARVDLQELGLEQLFSSGFFQSGADHSSRLNTLPAYGPVPIVALIVLTQHLHVFVLMLLHNAIETQ